MNKMVKMTVNYLYMYMRKWSIKNGLQELGQLGMVPIFF
jgi:hypothetical protein